MEGTRPSQGVWPVLHQCVDPWTLSEEGTEIHDDQRPVLAVQVALLVSHVCSLHMNWSSHGAGGLWCRRPVVLGACGAGVDATSLTIVLGLNVLSLWYKYHNTNWSSFLLRNKLSSGGVLWRGGGPNP